MPEAHTVMRLHELNRIACLPARHAVKEPFRWRHNEIGRLLISMERAQPFPILRPVLLQGNASALHQGHQIRPRLHPPDVRLVDAAHA